MNDNISDHPGTRFVGLLKSIVTCINIFIQLVYTLVIIPIAVARFVDFAGYDVPFWLTITADFFFNLNGAL